MDKEMVDHPDHYNKQGIEVIDIIEAYNLSFTLGNSLKYLLRCQYKGNKLEDLKKARWYLDREINNLEKDDA